MGKSFGAGREGTKEKRVGGPERAAGKGKRGCA